MRKPIIAGNWKMNKTVPEAVETCRNLDAKVVRDDVEVVVCPPFTALSALQAVGLKNVKIGAQNMYFEEKGAYTGEISPLMLKDLRVAYVILGHSERREYFRESDELVNKKALAALEYGIKPIICVGETLEQRQADQTEQLVVSQIEQAFANISAEQVVDVVVAYEPIWAIGTGLTASSEQANAVIKTIRDTLARLYKQDIADSIRIQYGGSVKPDNIGELMEQPDIDGALVGGASLKVEDFAAIVNY